MRTADACCSGNGPMRASELPGTESSHRCEAAEASRVMTATPITPTRDRYNDLRLSGETQPERWASATVKRRVEGNNSMGPGLRAKAPVHASPGRTHTPDICGIVAPDIRRQCRLSLAIRAIRSPSGRRLRPAALNIPRPPGCRALAIVANVATPCATRWNFQAIQPIPFPSAVAATKDLAFISPGAGFVVANIRVVAPGVVFLRLGATFLISAAGFLMSAADFVVVSLWVVPPRIAVGQSPDIANISLDSVGISSNCVALVHGAVMLGCVAAAPAPGLCGLVCVRPSFASNHHTMLYHAISQA